MNREQFEAEAKERVAAKLGELEQLDFAAAGDLPGARVDDIVVAGKEVQLTIFKQADVLTTPGAVLVTVQLARAGLGGLVNFQHERGLVYAPGGAIREATASELEATGG